MRWPYGPRRAGAGGRAPQATPDPGTARAGGRGTFRFRTDIEGLRGLAMVLVLLFHAGVPAAPGGYVGLDVFFVISGFLITGLLLAEVDGTRSLSLRRFFARRIRRLLPSLFVVLGFVVLAAAWIVPPVDRPSVDSDVVHANLYVANWRFAAEQIDYLSQGTQASPVQHCWSLSVEEQFYLLWPALLLAAALWWRRREGRSLRAVAVVPIAIVGGASLAYSVLRTADIGAAAYFSTSTRTWEFAAGAAVALIPARAPRPPRWAAAAAVWLALAAIAWSAVTYDEFTPFPGAAALVPVVAAMVIIAAGIGHADTLPARLIAVRPTRWVGRVSYSWYLWHWPLLVFAAILWGPLTSPQRAAVILVSAVPALIAFHLIEEPFRRARWLARRPRLNYQFAASCTIGVVVAAVLSSAATPTIPMASASETPGAKVLAHSAALQRSVTAIRPNPRSAVRDRGAADADGCLVSQRATRSGSCVYGDPSSSTTVVLLGDSHAMQWFAALRILARRRHWRLVVLTKSACTPALVNVFNAYLKRPYRECPPWRGAALRRIADEQPAMVVTSGLATYTVMRGGRRLEPRESASALESGLIATFRRLRATGARVYALRDSPPPTGDPRACVSRSIARLARCAFATRDAYAFRPVGLRAARHVAGARGIDTRPAFCPGRLCPAVIGNALVYRNAGHITATYMRTLAPWLGRQLPRDPRPTAKAAVS